MCGLRKLGRKKLKIPIPLDLGKNLVEWYHRMALFWGGVWGGFLEKMLPNREKTTPKPTPMFWRSACNHNSFGGFRAIGKTLLSAFHAGNRGSNPLGDAT